MDSGQNDNLRVSNADRAHVSGLLERAVGDGMISLDEFAERTDAGFCLKVTLPVVVSTLQPAICSTPFRARRMLPATSY